MSTKSLKRITIFLWVVLYLLIAIAIWTNIPSNLRANATTLLYVGYLQRVVALWAFVMMADQIIVGAFMPKITEVLGGWFYRYHLIQGGITYSLILIHPVLYFIFLTIAKSSINPFFVFTDFCVICVTPNDLYLSLGRFSFWIALLAGFAALIRIVTPLLRNYWRYFHILSYFVFILIAAHAWFIGRDFGSPFLMIVYLISMASVLVTIIYKIVVLAKDNISIS